MINFYNSASPITAAAESSNVTLNGSNADCGIEFINGTANIVDFGGSGDDTFFAGSGTATITSGAGFNYFDFTRGYAGGLALVTDFRSGDDVVLRGYGSGKVSNALASVSVSGGNTG